MASVSLSMAAKAMQIEVASSQLVPCASILKIKVKWLL